jgi:uncharacterized protein with PIN domain
MLGQAGYILDTSVLVGYVRNAPDCHAFIWAATQRMSLLMAPTAAVTSAWARTVDEPQRNALQELLDYPGTRVEPLDEGDAAAVGLILASAGQVVVLDAGHVVWRAQRWGLPVVTTQPGVLAVIDPGIPTINLGR